MSITGQRLKERRKEIGISADDIANELGVSRSTIFRYESGQIEKVPANVIEELATILRTTPAYLMGWTDDSEDWEQVANEEGICPPNEYNGDPENWLKMKKDLSKSSDYNSFLDNEYAAKDDTERRLLILCRKAGDVPMEEKEAILKNFEATMDMYLRAKGIKKE